jgi:hypothetical protein
MRGLSLEQFIMNNKYNYVFNEETSKGTFSRKDNERCLIEFSIDSQEGNDRLKIELFQCFPPVGFASASGVPRSSGAGREMMLYFFMFIKTQFPNIRTVFLEAQPFPDKENMTEEQYQEYYYDENLKLYQRILEKYYNSLGFTVDEDGWFEVNIDFIIDTIQNYDTMRFFNSIIDPEEERKLFESFGIPTTKKGGKKRTNKKRVLKKDKKKSKKRIKVRKGKR